MKGAVHNLPVLEVVEVGAEEEEKMMSLMRRRNSEVDLKTL